MLFRQLTPRTHGSQQVKALSSRLNEYRVKADRLETDLKKTRSALKREVGPNVPLDEVCSRRG